MISFWRIFWLESVAILRSKTPLIELAACIAWLLAVPRLFGSESMRYSLGGVVVILAVASLFSSAGSVARERTEKRLQLTLVRPVRGISIALAKIAAQSWPALVVLMMSFVAACAIHSVPLSTPCRHVLSPILPSAREEALTMYDVYMNDPDTPKEVKTAKKSTVLRLLENRAADHYQTIPTNATVRWNFRNALPCKTPPEVRFRFSGICDTRVDARGTIDLAGVFGADISRCTKSVSEVALAAVTNSAAASGDTMTMTFVNGGKSTLMLRPRKDVKVLIAADTMIRNLVRAYVQLAAILILLVSFGVFLGSALGRATAVFTAMVVLVVGEMGPVALERYPDELETASVDRMSLALTRMTTSVTRPFGSLKPITLLTDNECVETSETIRIVLVNCLLLPILLAGLSALALPRKRQN